MPKKIRAQDKSNNRLRPRRTRAEAAEFLKFISEPVPPTAFLSGCKRS